MRSGLTTWGLVARSSTSFQPGNRLGAKPGNKLALRHGAYDPSLVQPMADELSIQIRQEIMELPYTLPVDATLVDSYSYVTSQIKRVREILDKSGGAMTTRGGIRPGAFFLNQLIHRQQELAKVIGVGAAPRASMMQAMAGARKDTSEVQAAQARLRSKYPQTDA
jgi:hypothetical protein